MSQGITKVTLNRDGSSTPWGFRLHGGKDIGYPLVIQRVFLGSPSEGDLQRGDVLLQVQDRDAENLTHIEAHDLIKSAGSQLRLLVHRFPGAPQSPGAFTPTSPTPGAHPFATLSRAQHQQKTAPMFQPMSPPRVTPQPPHHAAPAKDYCFSPLPTTPIQDLGPGGFFSPTPRNLADVEVQEYRQEKTREKSAIVHQGYRTLPLIAPKPKTRHDVPMGSYLRHVHDPNWRGSRPVSVPKPVFTNFFPSPTYSKVQPLPKSQPTRVHNFERPIDENSQLVHHQYNSPLLMYSQKNVDATIKEQTGIQSPSLKTTLSVSTPPGCLAGPLSPGGTSILPAKPGTKLTNIVDITLSPTFQLIQEAENRSASPRPEVKTPPGIHRVPQGSPRPPVGFGEQINTFGSSKEMIHQSGSFRTLMSTLSMAGQ